MTAQIKKRRKAAPIAVNRAWLLLLIRPAYVAGFQLSKHLEGMKK
jgi:hypothetical protein